MPIFLDANTFLDLLGRKTFDIDLFIKKYGQNISISALSIHILFYSFKLKTPDHQTPELLKAFNIIDLTKTITEKALTGPTADFEDNIQLHSAIMEKCDLFLTNDKFLLNLGYFGEMRILKPKV